MISIIIPAYNEEKRIDQCLDEWRKYCWNARDMVEILVVPNGCTDHTKELAIQDLLDFERARVHSLPIASKGEAVKWGMLNAQGDLRYMADVDLSAPPYMLDVMIDVMNRCKSDIVIGDRYGHPNLVKMSWKRRITGEIFQEIVRLSTGLKLNDTQCGFKLFKRNAADFLFSNMRTSGLAFDVDILARAVRNGYYVTGCPILWNENKESKVKLWKDPYRMLGEVLTIRS